MLNTKGVKDSGSKIKEIKGQSLKLKDIKGLEPSN